jgi:hypothetical protein
VSSQVKKDRLKKITQKKLDLKITMEHLGACLVGAPSSDEEIRVQSKERKGSFKRKKSVKELTQKMMKLRTRAVDKFVSKFIQK